jgi:hypothetical protein
MSLTAELADYVAGHRPHGPLTAATGALTPNGYRLSIACLCGLTFERWITPEEAARELLVLARLNWIKPTPPASLAGARVAAACPTASTRTLP